VPSGAIFSSTPCRSRPWSSKLGTGSLRGGSFLHSKGSVCCFFSERFSAGGVFSETGRTAGLEFRLALRLVRSEGIILWPGIRAWPWRASGRGVSDSTATQRRALNTRQKRKPAIQARAKMAMTANLRRTRWCVGGEGWNGGTLRRRWGKGREDDFRTLRRSHQNLTSTTRNCFCTVDLPLGAH
jgi:hypothetical protein